MLRGKIRVGKFIYDVIGVDYSTVLNLRLSSGNFDALEYLSASEDSNDVLYERRVDVKLTNVVVETRVTKVNNKKVKAPVNTDFFCKLGALLRYVKVNCTKYNSNKKDLGLSLVSKEFEAVPQDSFTIHYPLDNERVLAQVELEFGNIVDLHIQTDEFKIDLEWEQALDEMLFSIVDGKQTGFKFDKDYLGFDIPKQELVEIEDENGLYTCIEDVIKAHPEKEFTWLLGKNYTIVDDEHLEEICDYIYNYDGYVYYDTETTGLNINFRSRVGQADQLVGIVLSVVDGESFYFPTQMKSIKNLCNGDHFFFMEHYMRKILEHKNLVAHNMSFDWKVSYIYDINANIVDDTMAIILLTVGAERKDFPSNLKEATRIILGRDSLELSDLVVNDDWGESDIKFWDLPYELVKLYACADTDNTRGLHNWAIQNNILDKYNARKVYEIEVAFSYAVAYQEFYGHKINVENVDNLRKELHKNQEESMAKMEEMIGHEFNPNSPKQLQNIMYGELGIPKQISRKTGNLTTDKKTLKKLAGLTDAEDNVKYPFVAEMINFREIEGVRKIVDKFPEHMTKDGYIFSSVYQYGTTTGRVSIHEPNYQSYNDPVKKNVVPRPGYYMFDTDYSSVEYRILGNMVGNKRIMDNFVDPDFDYHAYQAAHMYQVPYASVTKKLRKAAKGINFGLPYGMGDESLGETVFGEVTPENTKKAASLREAYFKGQEDIRDWFDTHRSKGVREGFTETFFGRRRYYDKAKFTAAKIRRQAGNQVIQGTAADIYKIAAGRVFKRICKEGWLGKVLFSGFIHDELLGEVSNEINPGIFLKALREEFEVKVTNPDGSPWCPLYMGFGYGMSWYEAKSVELPIKLQWEFVDKYGESGFPEWDGNGRKFCDTIPDKLRDFDVRDIRNQLLDKDSQGKEIKLTLNKQLESCLYTDKDYYNKGIKEYLEKENKTFDEVLLDTSGLCKYLDENYHIQSLYRDDEDNFTDDFEVKKDTQDMITQYCILHDTDRDKINLLNISDVEVTSDIDDNVEEPKSQEELDTEERANQLREDIDNRLRQYGTFGDRRLGKNVVILYEDKSRNFKMPDTIAKMLLNRCTTDEEGYRVYLKVFDESKDTNKIYENYFDRPDLIKTKSFIKDLRVFSEFATLYRQYLWKILD